MVVSSRSSTADFMNNRNITSISSTPVSDVNAMVSAAESVTTPVHDINQAANTAQSKVNSNTHAIIPSGVNDITFCFISLSGSSVGAAPWGPNNYTHSTVPVPSNATNPNGSAAEVTHKKIMLFNGTGAITLQPNDCLSCHDSKGLDLRLVTYPRAAASTW